MVITILSMIHGRYFVKGKCFALAESAIEMWSGVSLTVVVATSVSVFLVSSVIIFIVGFICFGQKVRGCIQKIKNQPSTSSPAPVYEAVVPSLNRQQEENVELKVNVAYM